MSRDDESEPKVEGDAEPEAGGNARPKTVEGPLAASSLRVPGVASAAAGLISALGAGAALGAPWGLLLGGIIAILGAAGLEAWLPGKEPEPFLVRALRGLNRAVGLGEQLLCGMLLALLIVVGTVQALAPLLGKNLDWSTEVIRYAVFAIAMFGAALAAAQLRMISMDVLTRLLTPRSRAVVRLAVTCLVAFLALLVIKVGLDVRASQITLSGDHELIGPGIGYMPLPIGMALIAFHYVIYTLIDLTYLLRGEEPPEERGAKVH